MSRPLPPLAVALAAVVALAGCGGASTAKKASKTAGAGGATTTSTGCRNVAQPKPKPASLAKPTTRLNPAKVYVATVKTSCGSFAITLDAKRAPVTGGSFVYMARKGLYDDTTFHRVVHGFVIQGGDPKGNGTGGPGYSVVEAPPKSLHYTRGVVAMAKTQFERSGTSGSQFFVVTADDAGLPPEYALLGKVTAGADTVDRIASADVDAQDRPHQPIVIDSVTVAQR
jgi:cyclophilin family peptidyl-prolyl cis-trans isomerase